MLLCLLAAAILLTGGDRALPTQQAPISDAEFWRLVADLSEPGGAFPQQLMSNEDSAQFVLPALEKSVPTGGAYIGVGAEQNFTYLATLKPDIAFLLDIRRDNLVELLLYKAVFEVSPTRVDFLFRLFSRVRPDNLPADSSVEALFAACDAAPASATLVEDSTRLVLDRLVRTHGFALNDADQANIHRMLAVFHTAGPRGLKGYGDRTNPTYEQVMTATDLDGRQHSVLASESRYQTVRTLEQQNRIVPVVGDFAGDHALSGIGRFLRARPSVVHAFYLSNVERYLFDQGAHARLFYKNVEALPLDDSSTFIRSVITDITDRLNIPVPAGPQRWRTFLFSIRECLAGVDSGAIQTYRDLFTMKR